jgi:hypothetical protein
MVVYLAICDLFLGISHSLDHSYMLATRNFPPVSNAELTFLVVVSIEVSN